MTVGKNDWFPRHHRSPGHSPCPRSSLHRNCIRCSSGSRLVSPHRRSRTLSAHAPNNPTLEGVDISLVSSESLLPGCHDRTLFSGMQWMPREAWGPSGVVRQPSAEHWTPALKKPASAETKNRGSSRPGLLDQIVGVFKQKEPEPLPGGHAEGAATSSLNPA